MNVTTALKISFFCLLSLSLFVPCNAQIQVIPLHRSWTNQAISKALRDTLGYLHLAEKPLLASELNNDGSLQLDGIDSMRFTRIGAKLLRDDLVHVRANDFELTLNPVLDIYAGRDIADTAGIKSQNLLFNQRGIIIRGRVDQQLFFETSFYETQAIVPDYLQTFNNQYGIYPGFGRTKTYKENGYDFALAASHVTYLPHRKILLQIGQGKHFYGHGYRSLLWSDGGFVYPFVKARCVLWKDRLTYSTLYAELRTLDRLPKGEVPESLFKPKSASVHYLSFTPHPALEFGLFESIIWNRYDSTGTHLPSAGAAIPVIGINSILNGLDVENNSMLGVNASWRFRKKALVYAQCAVDRLENSRPGLQFGMRIFNVLKGLDVQCEYNATSTYFYASRFALQNYAHVNQPLGHPAGGAMQEWLLLANYRHKRFWGEVKFNALQKSSGPEGDFESNPDDIIITIASWPQKQLKQLDMQCGWVLQPKTRTSIVAGCTLRQHDGLTHDQLPTTWLWFGIRAQLLNHYYDYQ